MYNIPRFLLICPSYNVRIFFPLVSSLFPVYNFSSYLYSDVTLGVALIRQSKADQVAGLTSAPHQSHRDLPDKEASWGEGGTLWALIKMEEQGRALWV